jgi:hypothetical protein
MLPTFVWRSAEYSNLVVEVFAIEDDSSEKEDVSVEEHKAPACLMVGTSGERPDWIAEALFAAEPNGVPSQA